MQLQYSRAFGAKDPRQSMWRVKPGSSGFHDPLRLREKEPMGPWVR